MTSFYFKGLRNCFLEISIRLEVLLAALFISVSNRYQKKTIYCFSRLGKKVTKMCFSKGGILWGFVIKICLIKRSTEVIRTQWQTYLQDPHTRQFVLSFASSYFVLEFFSSFSIAITPLGEERITQCFSYVCSICVCLVLSVSSSSFCLGWAAACDCGTPWIFSYLFCETLKSTSYKNRNRAKLACP